MSQIMQQNKVKELQDLQARIQSFEEQAQTELQTKQEEMLKPLVDKAKEAIGEVAKEHGYTYVFDSALGVLLYSEESDNIMELVKKKLGIK
jgi:outer membrane protein